MVIWILIASYLIYFLIKEYNHVKIKKMRASLRIGDFVITSGGMTGIIKALDEECALIAIEPNKEVIMIEKAFIVKSKPKPNNVD